MNKNLKISLFCACLLLAGSLACSQEFQLGAAPSPTSPPPTAPPPTATTVQGLPVGVERHPFTITSCIVTEYSGYSCSCGATTGVLEILIDNMTITYTDLQPMDLLPREGSPGVYTSSYTWGEANLTEHTLTLTDGGFTLVSEVYDTSADLRICTYNSIGVYDD